MSPAMTFASDDERDAAAGEYVLGTLDAPDVPAFEAALASDGALRAEVAAWQDRLLALAGRAAPAEPAAALWSRIESGLDALAPAPAVAPPVSPAASPRPGPALRQAESGPAWWQRLGVWQGAAAFATVACVALSVLLLRPSVPAPEAARYLALLQSPSDNVTGWIVEGRAGGGVRLVPLAAGEAAPVPPGRSLQFWTKAEGAAGPTSLGLVKAGTTLNVGAAGLPTLGERQLFEITLEPEGGSTTGRPTGPILFVGKTVRL